jgi:hypothetical protein
MASDPMSVPTTHATAAMHTQADNGLVYSLDSPTVPPSPERTNGRPHVRLSMPSSWGQPMIPSVIATVLAPAVSMNASTSPLHGCHRECGLPAGTGEGNARCLDEHCEELPHILNQCTDAGFELGHSNPVCRLAFRHCSIMSSSVRVSHRRGYSSSRVCKTPLCSGAFISSAAVAFPICASCPAILPALWRDPARRFSRAAS